MSLAPLDVWLRLLLRPRARVSWPYWPRLAAALALSAAATLLTLPERLAYAVWTARHPPAGERLPPPLFILGYYRSGTTHLHYLLNCDPHLCSPRWYHTLAPQAFAVTWWLLRFFLIPFVPSRRVQDAMSFGINAPSEDDFALNNWVLASALPGRSVVPRLHAFYDRFHDLSQLAPHERRLWQDYQVAFVHKLSAIAGGRLLLLKTPSHTARVDTLLRLFPHARFIHISRRADAVVRSNVALLRLAQTRYALQEPSPAAELHARIVHEYAATAASYLRARTHIPPGRLAEVRYEELVADPLGELERIYRELDLPWSAAFEHRLLSYLNATRAYRTADHTRGDEGQDEGARQALAFVERAFGHDRPAVARAELPPQAGLTLRRVTCAGMLGVAASLACLLVWVSAAYFFGRRCDWLIWPTGIALGLFTRAIARDVSAMLGLWAAALALLTLLAAATATGWLLSTARSPGGLGSLLAAALPRLTVEAQLFWSAMGLAAAYKLAAGRDA